MLSIYLGGVNSGTWRDRFKKALTGQAKVFDPVVAAFYQREESEQYNLLARELFAMDECDICVFYLDESDSGKSVRLKIGDAVGRGKQVVVCLDGDIEGNIFIRRYCEYRGVSLTFSFDEFVGVVGEYLSETMKVAAYSAAM